MKKLKIKFLKKYSALIAAVVGLFSSSPCSMVQPVEYGTPSARYVVDGKVTDNGTGKPIENIRVSMGGDTAFSKADGSYGIVRDVTFPKDTSFTLKFEDTDGSANGQYANLDTVVKFKKSEFKGSDGKWNYGENHKNIDIKLNKK